MSVFAPHTDTRGSYFGGLQNVCQTDLSDVPEHDPEFDPIADAADREMFEVLAQDRATILTEDAVREFVVLS